MKKTAVLLVSTLMLGLSASAMADSNRWNNYPDRDRHDQRYDRHDHRGDRYQQPKWSNDRWNKNDQRVYLKRGERLPAEYRKNRYVVSNYRVHRLYEPPRGYNWMQVQGKYVLVDSKYKIYRVA